MIHAAAKGEPYACFVRPDTRIPFMAMPDGVEALLTLAAAPRARPAADRLQRRRVQSRRPRRSATSSLQRVSGRATSPGRSTRKRQAIVDSWPADVDDSRRAARLGLPAALRLRTRLQRVPHPDDPQAATPAVSSDPLSRNHRIHYDRRMPKLTVEGHRAGRRRSGQAPASSRSSRTRTSTSPARLWRQRALHDVPRRVHRRASRRR